MLGMATMVVNPPRAAAAEFGLGFLGGAKWQPSRDLYGVLPFLVGTGVSSLIAILLALPLGLAVAIFLSEDFLPPPVRQAIRFTVEMLAAIPSVVYGLWGIFVLVPVLRDGFMKPVSKYLGWIPLFRGPAYGPSLLAAGVLLAIMIVLLLWGGAGSH